MKFIDLFAGIGGFHQALKGIGHCVFASEIDRFAQKTYLLNHGIFPVGDITQIKAEDVPSHDLLCAGFPCQAFSIAGKRKGFEDARGNLFFEIVRIADYHRPRFLLLENVKGLLSHDSGTTFKTIVSLLEKLEYKIAWKVLNAKDFGVPQNRERVFIVCFQNENDYLKFEWPQAQPLTKKLSDIVERSVQKTIANTIRTSGRNSGIGTKHNWDSYCYSDTRNGENTYQLTPRDCARLQGFPDTFEIPVSANQAYKQFGNAVCVPVVRALVEKIHNLLV